MIPYYVFEPTYYILGLIPIQLWGLMVGLGFLLGLFISRKEAEKKGLDKDVLYDIFVWIFIGTIIGARVWFVLFYWPADSPRTLWDMLAFWHGGMAFFGGFLGALMSSYYFTRSRKLPFWNYADAIAPGVALGHAVGRVGCYLTGLHLGKITTMPWAFYVLNGEFAGQLRHPVVVYEILYLVIIFFILIQWKPQKLGGTSALYGILYGCARFVNDFFRDPLHDPTYWGLTATQYGLLVLIILGLWWLMKNNTTSQQQEH